MKDTQTPKVLDVLKSSPSEKVAEVKGFAVYLHERDGKIENTDESDEWIDEDLQDVSTASLRCFAEHKNKVAEQKPAR